MTSNKPDSNEASGFEPRGTRSKGSGSGSHGSPDPASNCLKWADNLQELLNDPVGLNLFEEYLEKEDHDRFYMLKFWYACRGVSQQQDARTADQAIKIIYRNLFSKIKSGIKDEVKSALAIKIKEAKSRRHDPNNPGGGLLNASIFNDACKIVMKEMNEIMYPNFLRSDTYLKFMQGDQCVMDDSSCEALAEEELPVPFMQTLPVVDEDQELAYDETLSERGKHSSESFLGKLSNYSRSPRRPSNLRLPYYSYAPNSELQSVSSGARTDSLLDLSVDDAAFPTNTYTSQRLQMQKQRNSERPLMSENRTDDRLAYPHIPRTSHPDIKEKTKSLRPAEFAEALMSKLEIIKKEIDSTELCDTKIRSIDGDSFDGRPGAEQGIGRDTFINDDDQEILDKHVSRIWSDKTPRRSPSVGTPVRPKSPDSRRSWSAYPPSRSSSRNASSSLCNSSYCGSVKHKSKEFYPSVFSLDSGNYTDLTEGRDNQSSRMYSRVRSVSEYGHPSSEHDYPPSGYQPRSNRPTWTASRRTLTDSGVSDTENSGSNLHLFREKIYPSKNTGFSAISEESTMSSSSSKHRTKSSSGHSRTKSGSSERSISNSSCSKNLPRHPFVQDPNIPPFAYHNLSTDIHLEETRRRLEVDQNEKMYRSSASSHGPCSSTKSCESSSRSGHFLSSSKSESSQRSLMTPRSNHRSYIEELPRGKPTGEDSSSYTHVVCNFSDEQMPYLVKVPGNPITLKLLKEFIPPNKMGRYRYFFVKQCEELNNQPIQEEIFDDNEILPLFKGKVNAQIKAIE